MRVFGGGPIVPYLGFYGSLFYDVSVVLVEVGITLIAEFDVVLKRGTGGLSYGFSDTGNFEFTGGRPAPSPLEATPYLIPLLGNFYHYILFELVLGTRL